MIHEVQFPDITSPQINIALLADKVNELIRFVNEHTIEEEDEEEETLDDPIPPPLPDLLPPLTSGKVLKSGVKQAKNGTFYIPGHGFIKNNEAYVN